MLNSKGRSFSLLMKAIGTSKTQGASPGEVATEQGNPCLARPGNPASGDAASPFRRKVPGAGNAIKSGGLCQARQQGVPANRGRAAKSEGPCRFGTGKLTQPRGTAGRQRPAHRPVCRARRRQANSFGTAGRVMSSGGNRQTSFWKVA